MQALSGGALYIQDIATIMSKTLFKANRAVTTSGQGGGIYFAASANYTYTANTVDMTQLTFDSNSVRALGLGW